MSKYILDGKTPVPCSNDEWVSWFASNRRSVARTEIKEKGLIILTVFTGIDRRLSDEHPTGLFETMVEKNNAVAPNLSIPPASSTLLYSSWEDAERGHQQVVEELRQL